MDHWTVSIRSLKFLGDKTLASGLQKIYTEVTVQIGNPSQVGATLNRMILDISYQGRKVAQLVKTESVDIKPNSTVALTLQVAVDSAAFVGVAKKAIAEFIASGNLKYHFRGDLFFNIGKLHLDETETVI